MRCCRLPPALGLVLLWAQLARADDPVLHEYVPHVNPAEVTAALGGVQAAKTEPAGSQERAAADSSEIAPAHAPENFRPDRLTSLESGLDYFEVFDPSIAPFKRMLSLDATRLDVDDKTPVLGVHDSRRRSVPIEDAGAPAPDIRPRDRFSAELDLDFSDDAVQRLPSVSPESRIFDLRTSPAVTLRIERDAADNYYARVAGQRPKGAVHVTFTTDAPRAYFGTPIPRVPLRSLPAEVAPLPASVARRALKFAGQLGLSPKSDLRAALDALTQYFRGFVESSSPPDNTGDLYLDLVRGRKGLCRHRAYGFVVTAHALGIPARFVQNEAHSWVEVKLPGSGFLRIDLGGAAHGLTAHSTHDRPMYVPAQPDTLPRPESYRESYARAAVENARKQQPAAAAPVRTSAEADSFAGRWIPETRFAAAPGAASEGAGEAQAGGGDPQSSSPKVPLQVTLDDRRMSALRGGKLVLTGRLTESNARGVPELRVEVWIVRNTARERMLLGVSVTDADGYFRTSFAIPPDLEVGDYRLVVASEGDATHLPVVSD